MPAFGRRDFPALDALVHLATASRGPMPKTAIDALLSGIKDAYELGSPSAWEAQEKARARCRKSASSLLRCKEDEVGLVFNTTHGINAVASGIKWRRKDCALVPDVEYPANVAPWVAATRRAGARVIRVPTREGVVDPRQLDALLEAYTQTRLVAISHVEFANGARNDVQALSEVAHRHDALLVLDAAQSLGVLDVDVERLGIDVLSSCGYKWLCGPSGTGVMYLREDLIDDMEPAYIGFESLDPEDFRERFAALALEGWKTAFEYPLSSSANRFEFGESSGVLYLAFAESLDYIRAQGTRKIESSSRRLVDTLVDRLDSRRFEVLTPRAPESRAGIVTFRPTGLKIDCTRLSKMLEEKGVLVTPRQGGIRASCHFFNSEGDLETLLGELDPILSQTPGAKM